MGDQGLVGTAAREVEHHPADCDDDASRHFQELEPDGMDLGPGQFGPLQSFTTQVLHEHIGGRGQQETKLVGHKSRAAGAVGKQYRLAVP